MKNQSSSKIRYVFTLLNIVIGWHLLYEGIVKLMDPSWTSAAYLVNARGIFAGMFQHIAESPFLLPVVDVVNMIGLSVIGLFLIIGLFTRYAAIGGAVLIGLYYIANVPWTATSTGYAVEGHYLIVNKNLVEIVALITIAVIPQKWYFGIDHLINAGRNLAKKSSVEVPDEINHDTNNKAHDRRAVLKNLISLPFIGGFAFAIAKNHGWKSYEEVHLQNASAGIDGQSGPTVKISDEVDLTQLKKPIPKGKIGNVEIGRLICGGNLISGFSHSRDLIYVSTFLKKYFTDKKVMDTFWLCEECGVNTTMISARPKEIELLNNYWKEGGKIQWIAPTYPKEDNYRENIDLAIENGAMGAMIMGNIGDRWAREGKFELINEVVAYIKSKGVVAGVAGHELTTFQSIEEHGVNADFYMKTLHNTDYWSWQPDQKKDKMIIDNYAVDNYWARKPEDTIAFMDKLNKPWIAFKVLAAGALHPKEGFRYVFENGADFACVGMFDFQVVENANIFNDMLDDQQFNRKRGWMA